MLNKEPHASSGVGSVKVRFCFFWFCFAKSASFFLFQQIRNRTKSIIDVLEPREPIAVDYDEHRGPTAEHGSSSRRLVLPIHVGLKTPRRIMESSVGVLSSTPMRDTK